MSLNIVFFLCLCAAVIAGCENRDRSANRPVIYVLDTFVGHESHGQDVTEALQENVGCCEIKTVSLGEKVQRDIYLAILADILDYAENNPRAKIIVNMSFGSYAADPREKALVEKMVQKGILLVAAAGNDQSDRPMYPAGYPGVLAVAAIDGADRKTSYSNFGRYISIAADGFLKSKMSAQGLSNVGAGVRQNFTYMIYGGTSFAAPRVSGLLGLLMSREPELTCDEAVKVLLQTAAPLEDDAFYKAQLLGAGRIDHHAALYQVDSTFRKMIHALQVCWLIFITVWLTVSFRAWKQHDLFGPFVQGLLMGAFLWGLEFFALRIWGEILGRQIGLAVWAVAGLIGFVVLFNRRREGRFVEGYQFNPEVFTELGTFNPSTGRWMLQRPWLLDHLIFVEKIRPDLAERILEKSFGNDFFVGIKVPTAEPSDVN